MGLVFMSLASYFICKNRRSYRTSLDFDYNVTNSYGQISQQEDFYNSEYYTGDLIHKRTLKNEGFSYVEEIEEVGKIDCTDSSPNVIFAQLRKKNLLKPRGIGIGLNSPLAKTSRNTTNDYTRNKYDTISDPKNFTVPDVCPVLTPLVSNVLIDTRYNRSISEQSTFKEDDVFVNIDCENDSFGQKELSDGEEKSLKSEKIKFLEQNTENEPQLLLNMNNDKMTNSSFNLSNMITSENDDTHYENLKHPKMWVYSDVDSVIENKLTEDNKYCDIEPEKQSSLLSNDNDDSYFTPYYITP